MINELKELKRIVNKLMQSADDELVFRYLFDIAVAIDSAIFKLDN